MQDESLNTKNNQDKNKSFALEILLPYHMQVLESLNKVCGKAQPNSNIKIRVNSCPLQETFADNEGDWCIDLGFSLPEGCHVVYALGDQKEKNTGRSCFVINKDKFKNKKESQERLTRAEYENNLAEEKRYSQESQEERLPVLIKPPMPVILYPLNHQTVSGEFKIIKGKAKAGNIVTVCIRGLTSCMAQTDDYGNFTASLENPLSSGTYTVTAFQADEYGNRSETASNTFMVI